MDMKLQKNALTNVTNLCSCVQCMAFGYVLVKLVIYWLKHQCIYAGIIVEIYCCCLEKHAFFFQAWLFLFRKLAPTMSFLFIFFFLAFRKGKARSSAISLYKQYMLAVANTKKYHRWDATNDMTGSKLGHGRHCFTLVHVHWVVRAGK